MRRALQFLVYVAVRFLEFIIRITPIQILFVAGRLIGILGYYLFGSYRRLVHRNLAIALGNELDARDLKRIGRRHFGLLVANILAGFKVAMMGKDALRSRIEFEGLENAEQALSKGNGLVYLIPHMGNWEVLTQLPEVSCGRQPATLYQPIRNPFLDALVRRRRAKLNYTLFDRTEGFHGPVQHIRNGNPLGILVDQHAGDAGIWIPFFNRLASTTTLAAIFSARTGAPLIPLSVNTVGIARWRIILGEPIEPAKAKNAITRMTVQMNVALEKTIRHSPPDWFWVHDRWKTPAPQFLIKKSRRGIAIPEGTEIDDLQKFRILVRSPNWLGDACMTLPAVKAIKRGRPDAHLTILTPGNLSDFWKAIPEVDAVLPKKPKESIFAVRRSVKNAGGFDVAIVLPNSPRTALEVWKTGAERVVGYRGRWRTMFLDQVAPQKLKPGPPRHQVHHYLDLAKWAGADTEDHSLLQPDTPQRVDDGHVRIGLCAGAEYGPAKRWPLERFAQVANRVGTEIGNSKFLLFGVPKEKELAQSLSEQIGVEHENLVGRTTMAEFLGHLQSCHLVITNDTGTMHLAAALGVQTVSIFGSTEPALTGPIGDGHTVIRHRVECSPCFLRECPIDFRCMKSVEPEQVAEAAMKLLTTDAEGIAQSPQRT